MTNRHLSRREFVRHLALGATGATVAPSMAALLDACRGSSASSPGRSGGSVSFAIGIEPQVLNPPIHTLAVESTVMSLLFPGLLRFGRDGTFQPELAARYAVEDGGLTYRFVLRRDLRWQDGTRLTAGDVAFTHATYTAPETRAAYLSGWDKIERVESPDDLTVVFRMKEAFAPFLASVAAGPVLPRHVMSGSRDLRRDPFNRSPVGCGPFKLAAWDPGSRLVLDANANYWGGRPSLDRFVFNIVPDAATQLNQLQAGEVDIAAVQPAQWDQVRAMAPAVRSVAYDDTRYLLVQLDEYDALRDVRVRQALDYATPKADIVTGVFRNLAVPAVADIPPGSPDYDHAVAGRPYDPRRAKQMLAQAGFTMQDGVMTRAGRPLEVPIYTLSTTPTYIQVAQVLKSRWSAIGVKTDVITMEAATLFSNRGPQWNGRDAAVIYSWTAGAYANNYVNWSSKQIPNGEDDPGDNAERYANPRVDDLVVRGVQATNPAQHRAIYVQLQRILADEVPVLFLCWPKSLYAYNAQLRGFHPNGFSGLFEGVSGWTKSSARS